MPVTPAPKRRRGRWVKRIGLSVLLIGVLLIATVALLPRLAGTATGLGLAESQINQRIPGSVSIDGLTARWFGGQRLEGVTLRDPEGAEVLTLSSIDLPDAGLWGLAWGERDLGAASVSGVRLDVVKDADGGTNLQRALSDESAKEPATDSTPEPKSDDNDVRRCRCRRRTAGRPGP